MAIDDFEEQVLEEVHAGQASGDKYRREHANRLTLALEQWVRIRDYAKTERKRVGDRVKAAEADLEAALTEAIAEGTDGEVAERLGKLSRSEWAWQEYDDARDERKEINSAMRANVKEAETRLRELMEESNQLGLFDNA